MIFAHSSLEYIVFKKMIISNHSAFIARSVGGD